LKVTFSAPVPVVVATLGALELAVPATELDRLHGPLLRALTVYPSSDILGSFVSLGFKAEGSGNKIAA
jgi:hypothetical protein